MKKAEFRKLYKSMMMGWGYIEEPEKKPQLLPWGKVFKYFLALKSALGPQMEKRQV